MGKYSFSSIFNEPYIGEGTCDFQLDIKMDGNIIADFIIDHNDTDYTEKLITLGEGKWDDGDDKVKLVLKDNSEIIDSNSDDNNIERKIISWNWYISDTKGNYILLNSVLSPTCNYEVEFDSDYIYNFTDSKGNVSSEAIFKLEVTDSEGNTGESIHKVEISGIKKEPVKPVDDNKPPIADIDMKKEVKAGQKVKGICKSRDKDGEIVHREWNVDNALYYKGQNEKRYYFYMFEEDDRAEIELSVTDNGDKHDDTDKHFKVINPLVPVISSNGALKENRKVNITGYKSTGTKYFPIQWDRTEWDITPMDGQSITDICVDGTMDGQNFDVLFKKPGRYKVWMKIYSDCTYFKYDDVSYEAEIEKIIEIKPDEKPIADMVLRKMVYRNPKVGGKAVLQVADESKSIDGDFIAHRKWSYAFDSNNNGSFEDENYIVVSDENESTVIFEVDDVGKYLFKLEVTEEFGQPTIEKFVTASDRRKDDNTDIEEEKRTAEVLNVAPTVELNFDERKQVDLILLTDYEGQALMDLRDQVDSLKMRLQEQKVDAEIYIFDNTLNENYKNIGKINDTTYDFYKKALLSYRWYKVKHREYHKDKYTEYNVNVYDNSLILEHAQCKMSEIEAYQENKGYYGKITEKGSFDRGDDDYIKYEIDIYDKNDNKVKTFVHEMLTYDGGRRSQKVFSDINVTSNPKNMNLNVQNEFYPYNKVKDNWEDYMVLDMDKLKKIKLRDNSDRYLIECVKYRNTLGDFDEDFKKYLKDNNIITRNSISDRYKEFYANYYDINDIVIKNRAIYFKTPYDSTLKIGDSSGGTSYLDFTFEKVESDELTQDYEIELKKEVTGVPTLAYRHSYSNQKYPERNYSETRWIKGKYTVGDDGILKLHKPDAYVNGEVYKVNSDYFTTRYSAALKGTETIINIDTDVVGIYSVRGLVNNSIMPGETKDALIYKKKDGSWYYLNAVRKDNVWIEARLRGKASDVKTQPVNGVYSDFTIKKITDNGDLNRINEHILIFQDKRAVIFSDTNFSIINDIKDYHFRKFNNKTGDSLRYFEDFYAWDSNDKLLIPHDIPSSYRSKKIDKIVSDNKNSVILFQDNTIIGKGKSDYGQLGQVSNKETILSYRNLYDALTNVSPEYSNKIFVSPMELVCDDVRNKRYEVDENDKLMEDIYNTYKKEDTDNAVILLATKANMKTFYSDYEDDPLYDYRWDVVHDETYYENDLGKDPRAKLNGEPIEVFDYTGHYKIDLKVQDNPVADDDRFDSYRLWNKDETTLNVYVHRKPRVRDGLYAKKTDGKLHVYAADEGSYDLDHLSQSNKGIRSHDWYWRTDRNRIWKNEKLDLRDAEYNTTYYISHRVKDEEGVWSEFSSREIVIGEDIPVVITANIDAYLNSKFDIDKIPVD
ncbi:MAG: hypothetical protein N4A76_11885, partial [Firmicutes bacterium]|nr:hypothetical protein [Bacillota bacterium]